MWSAAPKIRRDDKGKQQEFIEKKKGKSSVGKVCAGKKSDGGRGCSQNDNGQCYVNYIFMKGLCNLCQNKR
jgi:hypothetical protein